MCLSARLIPLALLVLLTVGCVSHPRDFNYDCGERFLLDTMTPHYKRLDVTFVKVNPDGSAVVRWERSGDVSTVALEQTATGRKGEGFFRLLASNPRAQVAVFETMWAE